MRAPGRPAKDRLLFLAHLLTTLAKLLEPGGAKAFVPDSLLVKRQLLIIIGLVDVRPI
jgi:hypothetical protein